MSTSIDATKGASSPCVHTSYTVKRALVECFEHTPLQTKGIPHPADSRFVKVVWEFEVILAHEPRTVAQVIFEVMRLTIGFLEKNAPRGHREWVALSYRHFERRGLMSKTAAQDALNRAIQQGYLRVRPGARRSREYAIRWCEDIVTP
jgi:hypothetical protein